MPLPPTPPSPRRDTSRYAHVLTRQRVACVFAAYLRAATGLASAKTVAEDQGDSRARARWYVYVCVCVRAYTRARAGAHLHE